jgi:hypothetical protein
MNPLDAQHAEWEISKQMLVFSKALGNALAKNDKSPLSHPYRGDWNHDS